MTFVSAELTKSAAQLASRADRIVLLYAVVGLAVAYMLPGLKTNWLTLGLGFALGGLIGEGKAFEVRLRAQVILCLVAIEANSRPG